jgi:hypothetical protein
MLGCNGFAVSGVAVRLAIVGTAVHKNRVILERSEESCNCKGGVFLKYFSPQQT